jgi:hypothetical protein
MFMYEGRTMGTKPTVQTKEHVIAKYVKPARLNGQSAIQIKVGTVQKELGWINRAPSVFSTLLSKEFQLEAGVELVEKRGGPASGGPSTTVEFLYRILDSQGAGQARPAKPAPVPNGSGLKALYGILAHTFRELGGGESFLRSERAGWGPDPWEKLESDRKKDARPAK